MPVFPPCGHPCKSSYMLTSIVLRDTDNENIPLSFQIRINDVLLSQKAPKSRVRHIFDEFCKAKLRQPNEPDSCSNPLRTREVF